MQSLKLARSAGVATGLASLTSRATHAPPPEETPARPRGGRDAQHRRGTHRAHVRSWRMTSRDAAPAARRDIAPSYIATQFALYGLKRDDAVMCKRSEFTGVRLCPRRLPPCNRSTERALDLKTGRGLRDSNQTQIRTAFDAPIVFAAKQRGALNIAGTIQENVKGRCCW